jgi:hypothetical protein
MKQLSVISDQYTVMNPSGIRWLDEKYQSIKVRNQQGTVIRDSEQVLKIGQEVSIKTRKDHPSISKKNTVINIYPIGD